MLQKSREAGFASALHASNVRVVDPADIPDAPYKPNLAQYLCVGVIAGAFLGIGSAVLRGRDNNRIHEPGECSKLLQLPELGVIFSGHPNLWSGSKPSLSLTNQENRGYSLLPARDASSAGNIDPKLLLMAEAFRSTIASLLLSESRQRVLVMASSVPGEGKTTIVSNLGICLAAMNKRVLLIDGDLRKPTLHKIFGLPNTTGWADLLDGRGKADTELPVETRYRGLYVLPTGNGEHSLDSLHQPRLADIILRFRRDYDMVLIDTPAMLHISDARVFGRIADGVVLIIRANYSDREAIQVIRQRFAQDGTPVLGAILNDWDPDESVYGYYRPKKFYNYYSKAE
jgi:polysaccharide biosynthesis transport protein